MNTPSFPPQPRQTLQTLCLTLRELPQLLGSLHGHRPLEIGPPFERGPFEAALLFRVFLMFFVLLFVIVNVFVLF